MKITLTKKIFKYIKCPACKDANGFELDEEQTRSKYEIGVLYCQTCGFGIICRVIDKNKVEVEEFSEKIQPTFVLLRLANHPEPVYLVVRSSKHFNKITQKYSDEENIEDAFLESDQVMFDYALDPISYLPDIVAVIKDNFDAPKQFLEYVATIETPDTTNDFETEYFCEEFERYLKK